MHNSFVFYAKVGMLNSVRIFLKVVERGSFSKAAKVLNLAPSSVTRTIDNLEFELKTQLFIRSTRQLTLTDKGNLFLDGAIQLVNDSDTLAMSLADNTNDPQGNLRISVFDSFGRLVVCPVIADFLKAYPKINIEVELENNMVDLVSQNIDLAFRIGIPKDSTLKARSLISTQTVLCASPEYLSNSAALTKPEDLSQHNCLLLNRDRQRTYWYFKKERRTIKQLVQGNLKSKGGTPLVQAALRGVGIIQLSNWVVADYLAKGLLVTCLDDWQAQLHEEVTGDVYAVYKQSLYKNPNIRLFLDFLIEKTDKLLHKRSEKI